MTKQTTIAPEGEAAVDATAATKTPSPRTAANALAYFMGDVPPPGSGVRRPREVDFGTPDEPNFQTCVFRPLVNEELAQADDLATVRDKTTGAIERIDSFKRWSIMFAYACLEPDLGKALAARKQRGEAIADTAELVRLIFRAQPGVLQSVAYELEDYARFGQDREKAIREVEAGKESP